MLAVREARGMQAPSRAVFQWVQELLAETGTSLSELDCIAFGAGPGSFTGVRVAVALAQGLGYARGLPLCPVSTLAALAAGALRNSVADAAACCLDARLGEVYFGAYRRDPEQGVVALADDVLLKPEDVSLPDTCSFLAVGAGWATYPQITARLESRILGYVTDCLPSAADVARLARPRFMQGGLVLSAAARPNYLRERVASRREAD